MTWFNANRDPAEDTSERPVEKTQRFGTRYLKEQTTSRLTN